MIYKFCIIVCIPAFAVTAMFLPGQGTEIPVPAASMGIYIAALLFLCAVISGRIFPPDSLLVRHRTMTLCAFLICAIGLIFVSGTGKSSPLISETYGMLLLMGLLTALNIAGMMYSNAGKRRSLEAELCESRRTESYLQSVNRQLSQANIALQEANNLKSELLNITVHDLKNPLGTIKTVHRIIMEDPGNTALIAEFGPLIGKSASQMLLMVEDLLESSSYESGRIQLSRELCDLSYIALNVIEANAMQAARKGQSLEFSQEGRCSASIDSLKLYKALDNLVCNAIKYSPYGSSIFISIARNADSVVMKVRDQGAGLTEDDKTKVFGKFQKLSAIPTGEETSSGLGLSIVKQIIELHGGHVRAESAGVSMGSTFTIELPYTADADYTRQNHEAAESSVAFA